MKAPVSFDNFPTFAANGSRDMNPESVKYSVGFVPADTFPAEWATYMFHGATKGVSDLNTAVASIWAENANVLTQAGITPNAENNGQLYSAIMKFINDAVLTANQQVLAQAKLDAHPVGSLYWSSSPTDPATLFGGTWTRIKDRFVLAAGDTYGNGATGGSATVQLTESNLPAHKHSCSSTDTNHVHGFDHQHDFSTGGMSGEDKAYIYSNQHQGKPNPTVGGRASATIVSSGDSSGSSHVTNITINFAHTHSGTTGSVWEKYGSANTGGMSANESHSHTVNGGGNKKASGDAHENMPPYIVKYCWERVA
jgi:hypothetical protein